jgi:hypothetical protein
VRVAAARYGQQKTRVACSWLASRDNVPALCIDVDFNHVQSSFVGDDPIDWVHVEVSERQHRIGQLRFNESAHLEDLPRQ